MLQAQSLEMEQVMERLRLAQEGQQASEGLVNALQLEASKMGRERV